MNPLAPIAARVTRHRVLIATELIDDIARLDTVLKASKKRVAAAVAASGTSLTEIVGIGPICAAIIIGLTGDVGRFETKGHFATYNATAPIEASSGNNNKHRLNPRGNRKLNHAIHIAAISQLRYHTEGRTYYDRNRATANGDGSIAFAGRGDGNTATANTDGCMATANGNGAIDSC